MHFTRKWLNRCAITLKSKKPTVTYINHSLTFLCGNWYFYFVDLIVTVIVVICVMSRVCKQSMRMQFVFVFSAVCWSWQCTVCTVFRFNNHRQYFYLTWIERIISLLCSFAIWPKSQVININCHIHIHIHIYYVRLCHDRLVNDKIRLSLLHAACHSLLLQYHSSTCRIFGKHSFDKSEKKSHTFFHRYT